MAGRPRPPADLSATGPNASASTASADLGPGELVGLELVRVLVPLRRPWSSAAGSFSRRDCLLVRAVLRYRGAAAGPVESEGWGECTALPQPTYSGEYTGGAVAVCREVLVPALYGQGIASAAEVGPALAWVKGHNMAKGALEMAVLDAELRARDLSLARALGRYSTVAGPVRGFVPAGVAVGLTSSLGELVDEVEAFVAQGYGRVKLKIAPGWDARPVAAVRQRWPGLVLMADANGAYAGLGPQEAAGPLTALAPFDLACIEQPLADDDLAGHAELSRLVATPLCLDEALTSVGAVASALALGACGVVNVKAGRLGGYLAAVRAHDLCARAGVPLWCGGMVETGIGRAANVALAALPGFTLPGDLSASGRFFEADVTAPIALQEDGTMAVPDGPGLGVEVDGAAVGAFATGRYWCPRP